MKKIKYILSVAILVFAFSSCGVLTHTKTFAPNVVVLNVDMDHLQFLGETEISVSYRTYLGVIKVTDLVNGKVYDATNKSLTDLQGMQLGSLFNNELRKAASVVVEKYPSATYYQIVNTTTTKNRLFLGSTVEKKARVRAYTFK